MRLLISLVGLASIALALALAAAGPGARFGIWDYGTGLTIIRELARPLIIAAGVSAAGFVLSLFISRPLAPIMLLATLAAGAAAMTPIKMKELVESNPFIHDVTTDFENPPEIVVAAKFSRKNPPEYLGDAPAPRSEMTVAEAQRQAFPDIGPVIVDAGVKETAEKARRIVEAMKMKVLQEGPTQTGWTIEAAYTSFWFGFIDDFVVRLTAQEDGTTRVDVRSQSRVGGSDLGANAKRVRAFLKRLKETTAAA